ncbi:MAG TPA: hypothetical protein VGD81_13275 [Opitutaceae bacterium]
MRLLNSAAIAASLTLITAAATHAQLSLVSLEQHNRQTNVSITSPVGFSFYATAEEFDGEITATVSANAGFLASNGAQGLPNQGDFLEYEVSYPTGADLLADFPLSATYTIATSGAVTDTAVIAGRSGGFLDWRPATPVFTLTGVSGTWTIENGQGVFTFDPTGVTSFTITTNGYSATTLGGHYGAYMSVAEINNGFHQIGEIGVGPEPDATPYSAPVFTFTNGLAANSDEDDTTYGFTSGTLLELEAGFFNVIGYDAVLGQAFVVGNTTSFLLRAQASAIPEPATYAQIFGAVAAVAGLIYRRRKQR